LLNPILQGGVSRCETEQPHNCSAVQQQN